MLRLHVVFAMFSRNFWSYFSGVIGYLFIVVFVTVGALAAFQEKFFSNNIASLDQLNEYFPYLLLFIVPAISMGVWSDERRQGTDELLFTLPVSDLEVLLGKYLAVVAVYTVALAFSLTHAIVLGLIGRPDYGVLFTTYFGYWLAGAALLSAGMAASYLTNSATVAFVLGAVFCAVPVLIDKLSLIVSFAAESLRLGKRLSDVQFYDQLSLVYQFRPFGLGLITFNSLLYFVSIITAMLFLNRILIGQRHWSGGAESMPMGWQYVVRFVSVSVTLLCVCFIFSSKSQWDFTSEKVYTVSSTTRNVIRNLPAEKNVTIEAYVSEDLPKDYVPVRASLQGLLTQYESLGGRRVTVRYVTVRPFSDEADAARKYGIEPKKVTSERAGRNQTDDVFLGIVVHSGSSEIVVPFIDVAIPIEYELTRSIATVVKSERLKVGVLDTEAKVAGGFDMSTFRSLPEWRLVTELKKQYDVESVTAANLGSKKFDVLIAVLPSGLGQADMDRFVDYVRAGNPTLILDDPLPAFNPGLSPKRPKGPARNPMMGMGQPPQEPKADGGRATALVNLLGIEWNFDRLVFDQSFATLHPEYADLVRPEFIAISPQSGMRDAAFNQENEVTKGMQEVLCFFSGSIRPRKNSGIDFKPLLRSGNPSGILPWDDVVTDSFMGGMDFASDPSRQLDADKAGQVIAAEIKSEKKSDTKIHAIYVADADIISDWFFTVRDKNMFNLTLDNVTFVLNAVDHLAEDHQYIALRSRRAKAHSLVGVEQFTRKARNEETTARHEADTEAKDKLKGAQERLDAAVKKISEDESLDTIRKFQMMEIARQREQRNLDLRKAEIEEAKNRKLDQIKAKTQRQIRRVESSFQFLSVLLSPIPAILLGLCVFLYRAANEAKEVAPTRRV